MQFLEHVSLRDYSTMRLGGEAAYACTVTDPANLPEAIEWATARQLPVIMVGTGSNIVWRDEGFAGLLIVNDIKGYETTEETDGSIVVRIAAGENWDSVVARTVEAGLTGIEALSLIPGTAGATPIQNVGAYGQEIADTLIDLEAYDSHEKQFVTIPAAACDFSYRNSRFKSADRGRYFITSLRLRLRRGDPTPPYYRAVQQYFDEHGITEVTPQVLRDTVIDIRSHKLPDPAQVANNGSFFANPIITTEAFAALAATYPDAPNWPTPDGRVKIPAAWLIEQAGFKDFHDEDTGMATWPTQPLVLVNERARSTADLLAFRQKILDTVHEKFGITLTQEPELLP
jgi:UDP-N-acetylmuramate dehydrogenase